MSALQELCEYIKQKPSAVLGNKFFDYRIVLPSELSYKGDRFEPRIFVISKFRIFLLIGKTPSALKIDRSFHILSIKSMNVTKNGEFDSFPGSQLQSMIELIPESLYNEFSMTNEDVAAKACHSFRRTYAALCDYYDQPYREEVSWDVEKIYTVNRICCLKDLLPITAVLQYSSYFTGLVADGIRISGDVIDVIMGVIRKSRHLQHLQLRNCALPRDFITLFASALQQNTSIPLELIDLSKNVLDDKKGFALLSGVLPRLTKLRRINFSECALSEKCLHGLTAKSNSATAFNITHLVLSTNVLRDDVSSPVNVISLCTSLRVLELTDTGFPLDKIWAALKYGGLQIEKLHLGGCYAGKKSPECAQVTKRRRLGRLRLTLQIIDSSKNGNSNTAHQVKEFFSMAVSLSHISFANTLLPADIMKAMLLGLASNQQLKPFHLDISGTCEKNCSAVLEACLGSIQCSSISLRDNNLENDMQGVIHALENLKTLRRVDLGGANLIGLRRSSKPAHIALINKIILDIAKLFSEESSLEELILSDARLGPHLSVLLNTLGASTSLRVLDISNNDLGQFGARILSKALQLNVSLRTIVIDSNHLGIDGLLDLATAINMNRTITSIPYPTQDVCECLSRAGCDRSRILSVMSEIEMCLERNRSPLNFDKANFRTFSAEVDLENQEKWNCLGNIFGNTVEDAFSHRMEKMIDDFVEQMRQECIINLQDTLSRLGFLPEERLQHNRRTERIAVQRLKEYWQGSLKRVFSDWRWQELCEWSSVPTERIRINHDDSLSSSASQNGSPCQITSTKFSQRFTDFGHRPRSFVGDLHSQSTLDVQSLQDDEPGITLDAPPRPSTLLHLQKSRPKLPRRSRRNLLPNNDDLCMSRSTDIDEDLQSTKSEDSSAGDAAMKKVDIMLFVNL
ncbi:leucine Rich repeat-containing domain protein [Dictyocaulus viviparus]|uniref:Leucine Rich repeat-containing domain protein n=1 Tax=Dictyocaulus viviparus TaxID=29172 RepID=A0A0D8XIM5_DICVI|nr:leucine Rich repeat-containing domain protein [Dictyocaulus viviparus]